MIRRLLLASAPALLLAGCTLPAGRPTAPSAEQPANMHEAGLERVMGKTARELARLFGAADLDTREGRAERLQFVGPACVLDAYLYPRREGGEPVVAYVDARLPDGADMDRASCVAALSRRAAAS
ncbi:MAG TPA: hypothetical protein VFL92_08275 [Sphingomonas sp.]|nr:hypothetical protein [Sphingomonas sp.]